MLTPGFAQLLADGEITLLAKCVPTYRGEYDDHTVVYVMIGRNEDGRWARRANVNNGLGSLTRPTRA